MTPILILAFAAIGLALFMAGGSYCKVFDQAALTSGGPTLSVPKFVGKSGVGSERLKEGRPVLVEVDRDGIDGAVIQGTIGVWGVNLHNPFSGEVEDTEVYLGKGEDGATGNTVFTTGIPYAAQSNYNNIVLVNGTVIEAGAGAGKFTVSDVGGDLVVTFGTALNDTDRVEVHRVVPVAMVAAGENSIAREEVTGKQLVWVLGTHDAGTADLSRTIVALRALN